jgi:predicted enzyme related to lactoylglutathione lyase
MPCWSDLMAPDLDTAKAFYSAVLGWTFTDTGDEYGGYGIAMVGDGAAAGIGPLQDGGRPAWTLYLASDDVDATASAIGENGGTVVLPPGDVGSTGRMCIASDPTGAVFGVWQAGDHIGAGVVNEPGSLVWEDLRSPDPDAARRFYAAVFGYTTAPVEMAGPDYTTFGLPGEGVPAGGMGGMFGQDDAPPHWLVYFAVADTDAAVAAARGNGGQVVQEAVDSPFGRIAGLADPAGAVFMVIRPPHDMPRPDRAG